MICRLAKRTSEKRNQLDCNKRIPINDGAEAAETGRERSDSSPTLPFSQSTMFSREYRVVVVLNFVARKMVARLKFAPGYNGRSLLPVERRFFSPIFFEQRFEKLLPLRTE